MSIASGFVQLDSQSRARVLLELVKACSYEEQLLFLELLQQHLHRDFITLLPEDLVEKVLSYLTAGDAITCTLVSKNWSKVIGECSSFWLQKAQNLGLNINFITNSHKRNSSRGLKELCVSAIFHQRYIHSLALHSMVIAKGPGSVSIGYRYAGNGIALRYQELVSNKAQVVVERIVPPHNEVVEVAAFSVDSFSGRIKWASSSGNYVLWKQVDGKWNGCDTTSRTPELDQWLDEPVSQGFHSIAFCHHCHLIAILSEAEDDVEVWDLQVVKLQGGKQTVHKMVYPLPLERVQGLWEKKRHFLGGDVTLLSDSKGRDRNGFCKSHQVLLQVDFKLVLHRLKAVPVKERLLVIHSLLPDTRLSKPLHIFSPHTSEQTCDNMDFQLSRGRPMFCYSCDYSRVALFHESYLYVWLLGDRKAESCADLFHHALPPDCKCVAVGELYAILASDSHGTCHVVVVRTGEILTQMSSSAFYNPQSRQSTRFSFFAPIDQLWLSGFHYADFCPIALISDCTEDPSMGNQFKALVGTLNHVKPAVCI